MAGLATGGAGQAAGAHQGAQASSTRRSVAMIQKVERRQPTGVFSRSKDRAIISIITAFCIRSLEKAHLTTLQRKPP
jgi:predicted transcriptional regulator